VLSKYKNQVIAILAQKLRIANPPGRSRLPGEQKKAPLLPAAGQWNALRAGVWFARLPIQRRGLNGVPSRHGKTQLES
jgi:hypothetical protein